VEGQERRKVLDAIARKETVSKRDAAILYRLAHFLKPENILELGTCLGYSAICLASGAPEARMFSIDQDAALLDIARKRSREAGFSNICFIEGRFRETMPELILKEGPFDLVFIDGDHREAETLFLADLISPKLSKQGVVVVHDIHHSREMLRAWRTLVRRPEYNLSLSIFSMGFLFVLKDFQKQDISIRM
jgi:predicted O-methyltransferase YrrM